MEGEGAVGEDGVEEGLVGGVWGCEVGGCYFEIGRWGDEVWALAGGDVSFVVEPDEYLPCDEPVVVCSLGKRCCAIAGVVEAAHADLESVCVSVAE